MVKIKIVSDLHKEFGNINIPFTGEDILILAGDIDSYRDISSLKNNNRHTIFVPGNHDFYGMTINEAQQFFNSFEDEKFHIGIRKTINLFDINFVCATLWTDLNNQNPIAMIACKNTISDFKQIVDFDVNVWLQENNLDSEYIKQESEKEGKKILITHHLPTYEAVDKQHQYDSQLNYSYANTKLDWIIQNFEICVHGHSHSTLDKEFGDTRLIRNPRGYRDINALNKNFDTNLMIEI
jgi:predicted phosphodiesterase